MGEKKKSQNKNHTRFSNKLNLSIEHFSHVHVLNFVIFTLCWCWPHSTSSMLSNIWNMDSKGST